MNSTPSNDPLVTLWQTASVPDEDRLVRELRRLQKMHRRLVGVIGGLLSAVTILLTLAEATGRLLTRGILSAIWIVGLMIVAAWHWRARCSRIDALTLDTVGLLRWMIRRAKRDLLLARCLYAGVPCGALTGAFLSSFRYSGGASPESAFRPHVSILSVAGLAVLLFMILAGTLLARSRQLEIERLTENLELAQAEL